MTKSAVTRLNDMADVGAFIRARRKKLGYTQAELAEMVGVGVTYLSHLENGKETAEMGKALFLLQMLGVDLYAKERS